MSIRVFFCAVLIGFVGVASAQGAQTQPQSSAKPAAVQALTPQQRAALEKQDQVLTRYAAAIAQMVDNGKIGSVWDDASEVAKHSVSRKDFVDAIKTERAKLGKVTARRLARITRSISKGVDTPPGNKLPAGYYVNVNFATQFGNATKPTRELVSFHLDSDKKWRLSGYHVY